MVLTQNRLKLVVKPWSKNVLQKPEFIKSVAFVLDSQTMATLVTVLLN